MPTIPQLPPAATIAADDELPISQAGAAMSVAVGTLLAGTQPAIVAPSGSLIGRVSAGPGGPESINVGAGLVLSSGTLAVVGQGPLPQTGSVVASDLVCISREGVSQAVSYSQFLDGQTIDAAQPARPASDTDTFWIAQGSNIMLRQSLSAIWSWIAGKVPGYKLPVVELTTDTTLDGTVHNARLLVCSQPLTLTPAFANMGSGFTCEVLNLSTGVVNLAGGFTTTSGNTSIPSGQAALVRGVSYSGGNVVFAAIGGTAPQSSGTQASPPGTVVSLAAALETSSSVALSWAAPQSGGPVSSYVAQYRITGTTNWIVASASILSMSFTISGLAAATSYDFQVSATGTGGLGLGSTVTASTSASTGTGSSGTAGSSGSGSSGTGTGSGSSGSGSSSSGAGSSGSSGSGSSGSGTGSSSGSSGSVSSITWNVVPSGSYTAGSGSIGVNAHVSPATAPVRFGFSTSATVPPTTWTAAILVNTDLWGAYVPTPTTRGTWYLWGEGQDGSCPTVNATAITVN